MRISMLVLMCSVTLLLALGGCKNDGRTDHDDTATSGPVQPAAQ